MRKTAQFAALIVAACIPATVLAQNVDARKAVVPVADAQPGIADIIVTAEKRSTSLQKTALAITALNGEALDRAQVRALPDIVSLVPNFKMGNANGYAQITIRGIGISNFQPTADSAVALNMNEIYISRPISQTTGLFDVSAVEVLRGPQGTLYGRNATAGAVNITSMRPTDVLSGYANVTVGNYGAVRVEGGIGGPLIGDKVLFRVAGFHETNNGYGKNLFTGNKVGDKDAYALRATLVIRPADRLKATIIGDYYKEADNGAAAHYFGAPGLSGMPGALGVPPTFLLLGGSVPKNPYDVNSGIDPQFQLRTTAVTGIIDWSSGPFSFKSVTGYRDQNSYTATELDGGNQLGGVFYGGEPAHQFSQEIQAHYDDRMFHLTAGLYYFKEHDDFTPAKVPVSNQYLNLAFPFLPLRPVPGLTNFAEVGGLINTTAKAVFAQGSANVTDKLSLTAGIRISSERKALFQRNMIDIYTPYTGSNPPPHSVAIPPKTFNSTTPKFGIQYQVTPKSMLYFTVAKGFKSGGFDAGADPSIVANGYFPEKLTDYEGGLKTTFLDNKVRLNLSGFYYNYTDLQVQEIVGTSAVATTNAGSAHVYGAEAEISTAITPELTIDANGAWLHARYVNYRGPDNALPLLPVIDFSGRRLNNAPDFQSHISATYTWAMSFGKIALKGDVDYSSKFYFSPVNIDVVGQTGFAKVNVFLTYSADKGWHATAFVRNLTNKVTRVSGYVNSVLFGAPSVGAYAPPRTIGVELGYKF